MSEMTRAERRRMERQGTQRTASEEYMLQRFERRHPGLLREHFQRYPVDIDALERESDAALRRAQ